jgi:hypothetical protein
MLELLRGISRYVCGWVRTRRLRCRAPTHHWGPSAVGCYWADLLNSSEVFDLEEARVQRTCCRSLEVLLDYGGARIN